MYVMINNTFVNMTKNIIKTDSPICKNLKLYRSKLGISQDRLSKIADLSLTTIVNIESGQNPNPTIDTISRLAKALNITVDNLIK